MISLRSSLRRALLTYLYSNRSARFYVRQLAARLSVDPTNLSRELAKLEKDGLLRSEIEGCQRYYQLNSDYPFLKPLFAMLATSVGIVPTLRSALQGVPAIESAYLYGSFARNESDSKSDIDVLILGAPDATALASRIRSTEKILHRDINYTVLSPRELRSRLKKHDPYLTDIWQGSRIQLVGNGDEAPAR